MVMAGCGAGDREAGQTASLYDPSDDGHGELEEPVAGMETQGQDLLGETLDQMGVDPGYHVNMTTDAVTADGRPVTVEFGGSAALRSGTHRGADPFFNGMLLTGAQGARFRITVARGGYDVAFYKLELRTASGAWADVCTTSSGATGDAIPLAGRWQRSGLHEYAADRFSFACAGATGYKCSVWSYLAGSDPASLGWRAHQACTRMTRGDYCGNGRTHTRDGTLIKIYDFAGVTSPPPLHFDGVQAWPPDVDRLFFEAAWNDGARPASCLTRLRWQSLPPGPACPGAVDELPDPRAGTGGRFCEDLEWPAPGPSPTGALLFNESRYSDLELHLWRSGNDWVSTVRGLYDQPIREPFPNAGVYTHVAQDGMLVRSQRAGVDPDDFVEVHVYGTATDKVVAASPPPGFEDQGFEGFVRRTPTPNAIAFTLYYNAATGDYLSTAVHPPPPGYAPQATIGYVLPPR